MMAVVHDLAEAIVGDIAPSDGIPKDEKMRLEKVLYWSSPSKQHIHIFTAGSDGKYRP